MSEVQPLARELLSPEAHQYWEKSQKFVEEFYHDFLEQRPDFAGPPLATLQVELARLFLRKELPHHPPILNELEQRLDKTYSGNTLPKINPPSPQVKRSISFIFQMYLAYKDKGETRQDRVAAKSRIINEVGTLATL